MKFLETHAKSISILGLILLISVVILSEYTVFIYATNELSGIILMSVSVDSIGTIICLLLFTSVVSDHRPNESNFLFLGMILFEGLLLMSDIGAWISDGVPDRIQVNRYSNMGLFLLTLTLVSFFWKYQLTDLDIPEKPKTLFNAVFHVVLVTSLIMVAVNPVTHCLFSIGDDFYYHRGPLSAVYNAVVYTIQVMNLYASVRYGTSLRRKITVLFYTFVPLAAMLVQMFVWGCSAVYISFLLVIILIYGNIYSSRGIELSKTEAELAEERFNVMFSQIQPHFLYNALTSIMNIKGNPPETKEAIADFGSYLRGNLNTISSKRPIPISRELDHVETYVNMEKLRFKERLNVIWHINDRRFAIPALTIQMMVENAIKHGVTQKQEGGTVIIVTEETEDGHLVKIIDNGVGFVVGTTPNDGRAHVGIASVRNRVEVMCGGTLTIKSTPGKGTTITVFIPKDEVVPDGDDGSF